MPDGAWQADDAGARALPVREVLAGMEVATVSEQIPLMDVTPEPMTPEHPRPCVVYLVYAYSEPGKYWKIHRDSNHDEYASYELAAFSASRLPPQWTHRGIIRIALGEEPPNA